MSTTMNTKTFLHRTAAALLIAMLLFAVLPAAQVEATSETIISAASGSWESGAWPDTQRSGTITVTANDANVVGTGTAFLTELSVGNILKTAGVTHTQIGAVASITDDTHLTLSNLPGTNRTDIFYTVQGVGPADNAEIASGHTVTIGTNPISQTGNVTVDAGGTLIVSKTGTILSTLSVDGTVSADESADFGELVVNSGGTLDAAGTGTTVAYTASALTINSGGTANISRNFTVDSEAIIAGTINFSSNSTTSRAMSFLSPVTLNSGAAWNEPASGNNGANNSYTFFSDFTNNAATFLATSTTSTHSFGGNGMTLAGSTETAIAKVDVAGTYTNTGILTVGSALSGTGALTNNAGATLNLGGSVTILTLANAGTINRTGSGSMSTALTNTGTINLGSTGSITGSITNNAGGTVNITNSGALSNFDNATATSLLNISDLTPPSFATLTVTTPGNTVEYSGQGDQTVKSTTYSNLVFSGSGNKSISMSSGSTLATGNLSITETAKASITGQNLAVNSLSLGGFGKINGTWGSSSSAATNKDDTFFAATIGYLNVATDSRATQTIEFTSSAPTNAEIGGTYTPTATATSGLPVTLAIDLSSSAVCSMSAGDVTFNANGTCLINANQAGNANYQPAPQAQQSIAVKINQTIQFTSTAPANAAVGGTYTPTATATSGLPVTLTIDSSSSSVCSISAGDVTFNANGTCLINANQSGDGNYQAAPQVQQSIAVKTNQTIQFTSTAPTDALAGGATYTPTATATSGLTVTFTINPSASAVCSISAGVVSFKTVGTCVINANQPGNANYYPAPQVQQSFAVHYKHTDVHVRIAGTEPTGSPFTLQQGAGARKKFALNNGPVQVNGANPISKVITAERVIYNVNGVGTSLSDMMALPNNQLYNIYWLPWYNNKTMTTQLQIANVSTSSASIQIFIGGKLLPGSSFSLLAGKSASRTFLGIDAGPVRIVSNVKIVASERVTYKVNNVNTSYSELMALPENRLNKVYWLPWYNNKTMESQLQIANVSNSAATVKVFIGGTLKGSFSLAKGASITKTYAGIDKGPVKIVSTVNILASERTIYKVNTVPVSYTEVMGLPTSQLDTTYWLPWYTNTSTINSLLQIANVSASPANVRVYINRTQVASFTIPVGGSVRKSFAGLDKGVVKIVSNVKIVAGVQVIYKVNSKITSYSQMTALPNKLLDSKYWLPWYNNKTMISQLLFGMP
jgi:hypothetical protein